MRHTFKIATRVRACKYGGLNVELSVSSETAADPLCDILSDPNGGVLTGTGPEVPEDLRGVRFSNRLDTLAPGRGSATLVYTSVPHDEARLFARYLRWKTREEIRRRSNLARAWNVEVAGRAIAAHLRAKPVVTG